MESKTIETDFRIDWLGDKVIDSLKSVKRETWVNFSKDPINASRLKIFFESESIRHLLICCGGSESSPALFASTDKTAPSQNVFQPSSYSSGAKRKSSKALIFLKIHNVGSIPMIPTSANLGMLSRKSSTNLKGSGSESEESKLNQSSRSNSNNNNLEDIDIDINNNNPAITTLEEDQDEEEAEANQKNIEEEEEEDEEDEEFSEIKNSHGSSDLHTPNQSSKRSRSNSANIQNRSPAKLSAAATSAAVALQLDQLIIFEEISSQVLEHLSLLVQQIYMPLFVKNSKNRRKWPAVVSQDVTKEFHKYSSALTFFVAQTQGKTVLPIPDVEEIFQDSSARRLGSLLPKSQSSNGRPNYSTSSSKSFPEALSLDDEGGDHHHRHHHHQMMVKPNSKKKRNGNSANSSFVQVMPPPANMANEDDRGILHLLESSLIDWSRQIRKVVDKQIETALNIAESSGKYLGPLFELDFWHKKHENLENLRRQLESDKISRILSLLESAKSSYVPGFKRVAEELRASEREAEEIARFLTPLRKYFLELADPNAFSHSSFSGAGQTGTSTGSPGSGRSKIRELSNAFRPLMYLLTVIWSKSKYYGTAARMVVLFRELSNQIIHRVLVYTDYSSLWSLEPEKSLAKLRKSKEACNSFKNCFYEHKTKVNEKHPSRPWKFEGTNAFKRFDSFVDRISELGKIAEHCLDFGKLENLEIGGAKGQRLTHIIGSVFSEFDHASNLIKNVAYDPLLDLKDARFSLDYKKFCDSVIDFDNRIW